MALLREERLRRKREWMQRWRRNNPEQAKQRDAYHRKKKRSSKLEQVRSYFRIYARARRKTERHVHDLAVRRLHYKNNRERMLKDAKRYNATPHGKAQRKRYIEQWRKDNPDKLAAYKTTYKERRNELRRIRNINLRRSVLLAYGGVCVCCGESEPDFLALDHIANDGKQHRAEVGNGMMLYYWARRNAYPKILQLLCHNCHYAKHHCAVCPCKQRMRMAG